MTDAVEQEILNSMIAHVARDLTTSNVDVQKEALAILRKHFVLARSIKFAKSGIMCFKMDYDKDVGKEVASLAHVQLAEPGKVVSCTKCRGDKNINSGRVIIDLMNQLTKIQIEYNTFVALHRSD